MPRIKEDIKCVLDDYRRQHKEDLVSSKLNCAIFEKIYDDFMAKREDLDSLGKDNGFFFYINKLNKLARQGSSFCGVDMADFAQKLKTKHSYRYPFDVNYFVKDNNGRFVNRIKTNNGYVLEPIECNLFSIFSAFVRKYLDDEIFGVNFACPEEKAFIESQLC